MVMALFAYYVLVVVIAVHQQERCRRYYEENACMYCKRNRKR